MTNILSQPVCVKSHPSTGSHKRKVSHTGPRKLTTARPLLRPESIICGSQTLNEQKRIERFTNVLDCSCSCEKQEVSCEISFKYTSRQTSIGQLSKVKLKSFDGNPPECSSIFIATADKSILFQLREKEPLEEATNKQSKICNLMNGVFWTVLKCYLGHSRKKRWKTACNYRCTA